MEWGGRRADYDITHCESVNLWGGRSDYDITHCESAAKMLERRADVKALVSEAIWNSVSDVTACCVSLFLTPYPLLIRTCKKKRVVHRLVAFVKIPLHVTIQL